MLPQTWSDDWNYIIRNVFFADDELRSLMKVPEDISVVEFIDRYFIEAGFSNSLLVNEPVRIVYGEMYSDQTASPHVLKQELSFDIYVKREELHNIGNDRLVLRTKAIANRIIYLLTMKERYIRGYRFWIAGDTDVGTTTIGYVRRNVSFHFMKVY